MHDNFQKNCTNATDLNGLYVREGSYGVLLQDESVLLCAGSAFGRKVINFPGGEQSVRELAEHALKREFFEEVGIPVQVREHIYTSDDQVFISPDIANTRMINRYFRVDGDTEAVDLEQKNSEVDCLFWAQVSDLPLPEMLEVDVVFSKQLQNWLLLQREV